MPAAFPVPSPNVRESRQSYKDRLWAAQVDAQIALKGQPEAYRRFCSDLKAVWAAFKTRKSR